MNHVVAGQPNGGINLYIELEKYEFDQIAAINIKDFWREMYTFLVAKLLGRLRRKT